MSTPSSMRPDKTPTASGQEPGRFLLNTIEEKPIWSTLFENIHDRFFSSRLPAFEMSSTPVPVPDRMASKANPWAVGTSTVVNGGLLAMILLMGLRVASPPPGTNATPHSRIDLSEFLPPSRQAAHGGGGGGANDLVDPTMGRNPRFEKAPIMPPQVPLLTNPQLAINPAVAMPPDVKLPDNATLPNIGVNKSTNVTLISNGPGSHAGIGTGSLGGDGPGTGSGYGPGSERGFGGGPYKPGVGGVSNPVPIITPEAEFSDEARRAKYQGSCMITIIVDARGYPQNPRIVGALGMGLDEKALEAVRKYRFKPAMKDGKPVPVMITVEVNFRLY
jgi:protein TonB